MKKTAVSAILLVGLLSFLIPSPAKAAVSVSISFFQHELAPYGEWVTVSRYGYCWHPRVRHRHWRPYWDGHWVWTDYGWTWVSYDPWGEYPSHYGTWVWVDDNYGWCWEPGYVWSPAWVTWTYTDDYIGWAPVPATFDIGVTGYVGSPVVVAQSNYVFVPASGFVGGNISSVAVDPGRNATFFARGAHNVTNFSVSGGVVHTAGPPVSMVERASGRTIRATSVNSISGHGIRPAAIGGAGLVAGRKMSVTAPAKDRAAVASMAKAGGPGGARAMAGGPKGMAAGPKGMAAGPKGMGPSAAQAKPSRGAAGPSPSRAASARAPKGFAGPSREAPSRVAHGAPPSARSMKSAPAPKHAERMTAPSRTRVMAPSHQAAPRAAERHAAPAPRAQAAPETRMARHEAPAPRMAAPQHAGPPPHAAGPAPHGGPPPQAARGGGGPPPHAAGPAPHGGPPPQAAKGGGGGQPKKEKGGK